MRRASRQWLGSLTQGKPCQRAIPQLAGKPRIVGGAVGFRDLVSRVVLAGRPVDAGRARCQPDQLLGALGFCDESDISVLDRHTQPLIRLPLSAEELGLRLIPDVRDGSLETLFSAPVSA